MKGTSSKIRKDSAETIWANGKKNALYTFLGCLLLLFSVLPHVANDYTITLILLMFVYIGYSTAWNIMSGLTGYVNFGFALFVGISSYTSVLLIADLNCWWPLAWVMGGISSAMIALLLGSFMLKLRGSYFAIGMLALMLGIKLLYTSKYLAPITRGGYGFAFIEPLSLKMMYYSLFFLATMNVFISYKVITSNFGARLIAIREDEEGAGSIGINATRNKVLAFVLSGFLGGLIASGHIAFQNYIEPESAFSGQWTIIPIVMVLLGGPGTLWGPVIGAVLLTFVMEFLWSYLTQSYMMAYGLIMILLVLLMPGGIVEWLKVKGKLPKIRSI
jgi:branched-chain amino acid transport system permease protein